MLPSPIVCVCARTYALLSPVWCVYGVCTRFCSRQVLGIASRAVKTVAEHTAMCANFVGNMLVAYPELLQRPRRFCIIVENDNGQWPVDGFIQGMRIALERGAPASTIFCAYKSVRKRNEETRDMEEHILYGVCTTNASKVLGVQYTRVALCCKAIRIHADFFSDGIGATAGRDTKRAFDMFFEQLGRFAPNKVTMRGGVAQSISYSGLLADGKKADDVCMAWLVFFVSSLQMFDEERYFDMGMLRESDTPTLVAAVNLKLRQFAGDIAFVSPDVEDAHALA